MADARKLLLSFAASALFITLSGNAFSADLRRNFRVARKRVRRVLTFAASARRQRVPVTWRELSMVGLALVRSQGTGKIIVAEPRDAGVRGALIGNKQSIRWHGGQPV